MAQTFISGLRSGFLDGLPVKLSHVPKSAICVPPADANEWAVMDFNAVHHLVLECLDILAAIKGSDRRVPVVFVGDSASWHFRAWRELGLDRYHPSVQLTISERFNVGNVLRGNEYINLSAKHLLGFYEQALKSVFPKAKGLPSSLWLVDYTEPQANQLSSVTCLQALFGELAIHVYGQKVKPAFQLLRLVDRDWEESYRFPVQKVRRVKLIWTSKKAYPFGRGAPYFPPHDWLKTNAWKGHSALTLASVVMSSHPEFIKAEKALKYYAPRFKGLLPPLPLQNPPSFFRKVGVLPPQSNAIEQRRQSERYLKQKHSKDSKAQGIPLAARGRLLPGSPMQISSSRSSSRSGSPMWVG